MYKIVDFTSELNDFAVNVLKALHREDGFRKLIDAHVVINSGWPNDEIVESYIGFEKETIVKDNGTVKTVHDEFSLLGLFYWSMSENEYKDFMASKYPISMDTPIADDELIINGFIYKICKKKWEDSYDYYPDGTLKANVIYDLECLVDTYYPCFTIVEKRIENKKHFALVVS